MDAQPTSAVALLSIHPHYADAIMRGEKRVEFRKKAFARPVEHVVIYATAPVQRVVGAFRVGECDTAEPAELWHRYGGVGGIGQADFDGYYQGREAGVAITVVGSPQPLDLPLSAVGHERPPQSFAYITPDAAQRIGLVEGPGRGAPGTSRGVTGQDRRRLLATILWRMEAAVRRVRLVSPTRLLGDDLGNEA